jgi:hypothetical protein
MVVWTAGYPGRGVRAVVEAAARWFGAIERDLAASLADELTETLRALHNRGVWAEQEGFLGERGNGAADLSRS